MEHVHEEVYQSSRLNSKYSKLPLDHHTSGAENMEEYNHLCNNTNHLSDSQESNSEEEVKHGIKDANNYVNSFNDNNDFGDDDDDDNDDDCATNFGVFAKKCKVQAHPFPNAEKTPVGSEETAESLTEELNASLRFDSQYSIDEDTGNSCAENNDGSLASSNSISSNNDTSCENSDTRSEKGKAKDAQKTSSYEKENNAELSGERNGNVTSQGARPKNRPQNPTTFNAFETNYHDEKIPSLETTGINQNFLARHSTDPSLPHSSFAESYDMRACNNYSNDWTQHSITSNSSSSSLSNLPRSLGPEIGGLMREDTQSRGVSSRYRDPMPVIYQAMTPVMGQFPSASGFSRDVDLFNWNGDLQRNNHQTSFSSFCDFIAGNGTQTASPSPGVSPLAPAVRYPAVTTPNYRINFPSIDSQFSSSAMSGSVAPVTSTYDGSSSYGRERVGNFSRCRPYYRDDQINSGLTTPEIFYPERREESLRNHELFNNQQEGSFASVSPRDPSLVSLEQRVAEIDRILKEREERTKRQREAAQRHREIREKRQREARERKGREQRKMREQDERERKEREQREIREREEREIREREEIENRERMERELEERRERETRIREDRIADESLPLQETPLWQCEHYQRRCSVKFPCCGVFYPCHRCHNLSGTCPADDKKAHHATHVKCGNCGIEGEINEGSQTCRSCGLKLSEYFCPKCKHFTGVDKNPFHCEKCEICRIYKDRSFHCDVCNVCLDKRLEGKHKCRPNSGHDECCICLEDAFSGCQILPCSHKVHRECAIAMIQNGVRNCPICRHPLYGQLQQ
ncbi:histone-lysine N-methyltransferase, H3 lysine-79 specific-like [Stylophora pistillata]|uniref:histone-lysine N-methyltransferase, H3 lysine-79 specific-like n=1 Tax=Stylophora pistillata TaxID=50429 RepID=UPI000C04F096|nr:histone-lysine N-methyltransferase, H3 lysine-79 specific-like [Stylophora pistillata]